MSKIFLIIISFFAFWGCTQGGGGTRKEVRKISDRDNEVKFPTAVWKAIERDHAEFNKKQEAEAEEKEVTAEGEKKEKVPTKKKGELSAAEKEKRLQVNKEELELLLKRRPPSKNFSFKIYLKEKTDGILGKIFYELEFPPGGGILDLSHYVAEKPIGSFYLKLNWNKKELPYNATKVYFISRSKERVIDGKKSGSGCDHFFDITRYFVTNMKEDGFYLNTSKLRHISLLAGIYYFVVFKPDGSFENASLEVLDSRHRELLCIPK